MGIIVTDAGFREEEDGLQAMTLDELQGADETALPRRIVLAVENTVDTDSLQSWFSHVEQIEIPFPSFADGRGFSIARELRQLGYAGRLRATGHLIADQYAHARRVGFDEVEISEDMAARQPEAQWLARAGWQNHFYQKRLQATA